MFIIINRDLSFPFKKVLLMSVSFHFYFRAKLIKTERKRAIKLHALAPWDQITIFPLWGAQNSTYFCSPTSLHAYARTCICSGTVYNLSIHEKQTHTHTYII